ncbi:MAG: glycosyltransferase family 10 [Draconibacterium sp.]
MKSHLLQNKLRKFDFGNNHSMGISRKYEKLFKKNGINLCYNSFIPAQYNPSKRNILLALESPAVVEYQKWLSPEMKFDAEISFGNFYQLENYLCCRDLYVNNDNFINIIPGTLFKNKPGKVSIVCSSRQHLKGHKFRHSIVNQLSGKADVFGSGYQRFGNIDNAFTDYKFQIVVENGKYPEYVSEKLFDCVKTQTIPIYWGGELALQKLGFNPEGFIFFDNLQELTSIIEGLTDKVYAKKYDAVLYNLHRLIELRNENKMNFYLNSVMLKYMHTTESYLGYKFNLLNLFLDKIVKKD